MRLLVAMFIALVPPNIQCYLFRNTASYLQSLFDYNKMPFSSNLFFSQQGSWDGQEPTSTAKEYDFIIVGAGPAGIVLANRLSEVYSWKILLLEAGHEPNKLTGIPIIAPVFQFTDYNWGYLMEKQDNMSLGLEDELMHWPRGRGLGGSSIINYMIAVRGNPRDYDRWASMGNPGWSYQDVLPYFMKLENSSRVQMKDGDVRGEGGFLNIEDIPYRSEVVHAYVRAAREAGHEYVDYNGHEQLGVSYVQGTIRDSARCDANKAYLNPVKFRPNLTVRTGCRVTKVLIDPSTRRAYGVEYYKNQRRYTATVTKEVILSAGAFHSPQLLMLSGIGPGEQLQKFGIPVLENRPVGKKMYDHLTFLGITFFVDRPIWISQNYSPLSIWRYLQLYFQRGKGPMASIGGVEAIQFIKTRISEDPDPKFPDVELLFIGGGLHSDYGLFFRRMFRVSDEVYYRAFQQWEGRPAWMVFPILVHPRSYGWLELQSADPFVPPKFYGNYFSDPGGLDMKSFIAAIREVQRIAAQPSLQRYGSKLMTTKIPGCQHLVFDTDDYWECAIRHISATLHHQVATCKMGPPTDHEAIVNHELKVYGVSNLRVADPSVIPMMISAHTNVPSFMIGEKAADLVKKDWNALNKERFRVYFLLLALYKNMSFHLDIFNRFKPVYRVRKK